VGLRQPRTLTAPEQSDALQWIADLVAMARHDSRFSAALALLLASLPGVNGDGRRAE
jgi:hypothetical protein